MRVDVAILTALAEEREAVYSKFKEGCISEERYTADRGRRYDIFTLSADEHLPGIENNLKVAICPITHMGPINGAIAASRMLLDLSPRVTVLTGIAAYMGEAEKGIGLGDVGIGEEIYDYMLRKLESGREQREWKSFKCDTTLLLAIRQWLSQTQWYLGIKERRPEKEKEHSTAVVGTFLSGPTVLADADVRDKFIRDTPNRRLIGLEMEAAGVKAVLEEDSDHNSFLVIKAFSDLGAGDKDKNNPRKDSWHPYSCQAAAVCTKAIVVDCLAPRLRLYRTLPPPDAVFEGKINQAVQCFVESHPHAPPFFGTLVRAVFESPVSEALQLARAVIASKRATNPEVFRARIGRGHQFLIRAREVFGRATRIYAFSVDTVSTFWIASDTKQLVKEYIDTQAGERGAISDVVRTFVFSTPEEAHDYARRLDYHAAKFPNTFVCSAEHYEKLLSEVIAVDDRSVAAWVRRDFALLEYSNPLGDLPIEFFADLEGEDLAIQRVDRDIVNGIQVANVHSVCEEFVNACHSPGEICMVRGIPILKWSPGLWEEREKWSAALTQMFEKRTADIYHVTGFTGEGSGSYKEFRRALVRMRNDIEQRGIGGHSLASRHRVKGIELTKRLDYGESLPQDGVTRGKLAYSSVGMARDVIVMRVADQKKLIDFLEDPEHTRLRLNLFAEVAQHNHELKRMLEDYKIASVEDLRRLGDEAKDVFERMEKAVGMWRADLLSDEMIEELVEAEPRVF